MLTKLTPLLLKKIRNRKSSARNRQSNRPLAGYESLEPRQLLASVNVFSEFAGLLNPTDDVQQIAVSVAPNEVGSGRDRAVLGFRISARDGNDFDPAALQIHSADGSVVTPKYSRSDLLGSTDSLVVAELDGGDYRLDVSGEVGAFSQFRTEVFLVGDVDGDHQVDRNDLDAIRSSYGARVGSSEYLVSADANLDGRITGFDLSMARRNEIYSRSLNEPVFASAQAGGVATANRIASAALVAVSSDEGLLADNTNDRVAGVTPQEGFDPDAPMRFFESETSWVQPFASATSAGSAVYANSDGSVHSFDWLSRSAGYNNSLFVYKVDDASGTIGGISPIEASADAYRAEAQLKTERVFSPGQVPNGFDGHEIETPTIPNDWKFFSFYVVQNGDNYKWFPFDVVNVDGYEHFKATATGFKVEDLSGDPDPEKFPNPQGYINDFDYNDIVFAVWRWGLDLDVDSDNNNGNGEPDRSLVEDQIEGNAPGKVISANIQDRDRSGILDFVEGYDRDGILGNEDDILAADFDQIIVELPAHIDLNSHDANEIEISIYYRDSDPMSVDDDNFGNPILPSEAGLIRLWTRELGRDPNVVSADANGDYVSSGTYTWADLKGAAVDPTATSGLSLKLYVEGITPSATAGDQTITVLVEVPDASPLTSDSVVLTIGSIDLQIDGLGETLEDEPGAIIWANSDFSKEQLSDDQPESGFDKYDPDYLVRDTFDPEYAKDYTEASVTLADWMVDSYNVTLSIMDSLTNDNITLWSLTEWDGMEAFNRPDGSMVWKIPTDVALVPQSGMLNFLIEGIQSSLDFAGDVLTVSATPKPTSPIYPTVTDQAHYTVVETNAGVDGNRDTTIDFSNSHDRQLIFWYNEDRETIGDDVEKEDVTHDNAIDFNGGVIAQKRDLEDFASLHLSVDELLRTNAVDTFYDNNLPDGIKLKVTYKILLEDAGGSEINLYHAIGSDPLGHVSNKNLAEFQSDGLDPYYSDATAARIGNAQIGLGVHSDFDGIDGYLFEANGEGVTKPKLIFKTIVEYENGMTTERQHAIELELHKFEDFYDRYSIPYTDAQREQVDFSDFDDVHFEDAVLQHSSAVHGQPFFDADENLVIVHGWNMPDELGNDWKKAFAETGFKRLYWQGFAGRFIEFDWPTLNDGEGPFPPTVVIPVAGEVGNIDKINQTYNPSEYQAYRSGRALQNMISNLNGDTHLLAHSMGNVVAAEAFRQWNVANPNTALVKNYVAMEAAISAGVYGSNDVDAFRFRINGDDYDVPYVYGSTNDLNRFWWEGRNVTGAASPYMEGTELAAGKWINLYNPDDLATSFAWRANNARKLIVNVEDPGLVVLPYPLDGVLLPPPSIWPWRYRVDEVFNSSDELVGHKYFRAPYTEFGNFENAVWTEITLGLHDLANLPDKTAYEIIAFTSVANSAPVGTKPVENWFDVNTNLRDLGLIDPNAPLAGQLHLAANHWANHSFQFNHDASTTWEFWAHVKDKTGFDSTH